VRDDEKDGLPGRLALAASAAHAQSQAGNVWNLDYAKVADGLPPQPNHIALVAGMATRPDLRLENGAIEFDLAPPSERFAGVAFRMRSSGNHEIVYFRPPDDGTRWAAMRYQPVFDGETTWRIYHGIVGAEADGIDLSLKRGATDVVLAVTDEAFRWGFRAKLDSFTGIRIETPSGSPR